MTFAVNKSVKSMSTNYTRSLFRGCLKSGEYLVRAQSNPAKLPPQSSDFNAGGRWYKTGHICPLAQLGSIGHHIGLKECLPYQMGLIFRKSPNGNVYSKFSGKKFNIFSTYLILVKYIQSLLYYQMYHELHTSVTLATAFLQARRGCQLRHLCTGPAI